MSTPTVLILQHVEVEKPGLILEVLEGSGVRVEIRNLVEGPVRGLPAAAELAGLVVMGGTMNVDDLDGYPGLKVERDLVAEALRAGVPTLGVCLGAQVIARVQGIPVRTGAELGYGAEIGWGPLHGVDRDDPVVGPLADAPAVLHWHGDRMVPGDGVRVLARTETTPCQAFRAGPAVWGLQFHLEVTPALQDEWLGEAEFAEEAVEVLGVDGPARLRAEARAVEAALRPLAERSLGHFRGLVVERAAALGG